jgi:nucleoside-diphosphate-sugar epimerase
MKRAEAAIRQTPTVQEFELYQHKVSFNSARAQTLLGYTPAFPLADGVALSAAWLKHHRYVGERPAKA